MKLLIKYPTRQRKHKFLNNLNSYISMSSQKHKLLFIISMDTDDEVMNSDFVRDNLQNKNQSNIEVRWFYGESMGKIHAINRDIPKEPWDIIISTADDMEPVEQNWDDIIVQDMNKFFPELDGSLNYNDDPRFGHDSLITLPIIGRKLYDRLGYIYHPSYRSVFCDNEQTLVFNRLGVLKNLNKTIIQHKWLENQDDLMKKNESFGKEDHETFKYRESIGFEIDKIK